MDRMLDGKVACYVDDKRVSCKTWDDYHRDNLLELIVRDAYEKGEYKLSSGRTRTASREQATSDSASVVRWARRVLQVVVQALVALLELLVGEVQASSEPFHYVRAHVASGE